MKTSWFEHYGDPILIKEVPKPIIKDDQVLIKVKAVSMNASDWRLHLGKPLLARLFFGLRKPKYHVLGSDVSGIIEQVGSKISEFKVGDEVFGELPIMEQSRSLAEYAKVSANKIALKPSNLNHYQASCLPLSGYTALQSLQFAGQIQSGDKILIQGASGGVGHLAVQIASAMGAHVTAICGQMHHQLIQSLGAKRTIDYQSIDAVRLLIREKQKFNLILHINGSIGFSNCRKLMANNGKTILVGGDDRLFYQWIFFSGFQSTISPGRKKFIPFNAKPNQKDLKQLAEYAKSSKLIVYIDETYKLEQINIAMSHLLTKHHSGKIVIEIS